MNKLNIFIVLIIYILLVFFLFNKETEPSVTNIGRIILIYISFFYVKNVITSHKNIKK
jgi:hypothetical protein